MPCVPMRKRKTESAKKAGIVFFAMLLTGAGWIAQPVSAEEAPPPAGGEPPKARHRQQRQLRRQRRSCPLILLPPMIRKSVVAGSNRRRIGGLGDAGRRRQGRCSRFAQARRCVRPCGAQPLLDQLRVGTGCGILGYVHAGRIYDGRDWPLPREELLPYFSHEFFDLPAWRLRVLDLWLRDRLGQLVKWACASGVVSVPWSGFVITK